jgi:DNA-binding YbaB/EbfC family protein
MGEAQEKLKELKETGTAGGDMVKVEINGHMEILKVKISPEIVDPRDPEMLEDLVKAAMADALFRIKEAIRIEMSSLTGGIKLPPGLGL